MKTEDEWTAEYQRMPVEDLRRLWANQPSDPNAHRALKLELQRRAALERDDITVLPTSVRVTDIDMPFGSMVFFHGEVGHCFDSCDADPFLYWIPGAGFRWRAWRRNRWIAETLIPHRQPQPPAARCSDALRRC